MATTTMTAPAARIPASQAPLSQVPDVRTLLGNDNARKALATVAARHMNPDRMMRLMANALRTTPKLGECDPMSLLGALMQCASLGIEPNTILGHAYLIPFDKRGKVNGKWQVTGTNVQLIVGYKGLIELATRSGRVSGISAAIHYSDDIEWKHVEGSRRDLIHEPGPQEGEKLHAYAVAYFNDGSAPMWEVLPWAKVMQIRDGSQGWQQAVRKDDDDRKYGRAPSGTTTTPWGAHEDAMARKTAIRALAKYLPLTVELADAMTIDGQRADFAGFVTDQAGGAAYIEGPTQDEYDQETGEVTQEEPAAEEKPAPRRRAAAAKVEPKQEAQAELPVEKPVEKPAPSNEDAQDRVSEAVEELENLLWTEIDAGSSADDALDTYDAKLDDLMTLDKEAHGTLIRRFQAQVASQNG